MVDIEITKGTGRQQKTQKLIMPFPTGYHSLPDEGGMLDQSYRLMEFFEVFMNAERKSVFDRMK